MFPYIALDGSVREQLRSTHSDLTGFQGRAPNFVSFWADNPLYDELSIKGCFYQCFYGDYCPVCRPDRMVYLSHRDCWKVAFSSHHWSSLDWSRLAVQTRPFETRAYRYNEPPWVYHKAPGTPVLTSVASDSSLFHESTPLGGLLSEIRNLPPELQIQIIELLKGTFFASLLRAKTFVSEMLPRLHAGSTWTIQPTARSLKLAREETSTFLFCRSMEILGRSYLSDLSLAQLEGPVSYIPIGNRAVRGLQFALGRFGLRGVRISYEDGSYSSWLGESSSCWIGTVRCSDMSQLDVIADVSSFI